ncbi:MAG: protein kinase [Planctomycetales bacterium]|nr:protein kinase [Planctomycetales bacterium]
MTASERQPSTTPTPARLEGSSEPPAQTTPVLLRDAGQMEDTAVSLESGNSDGKSPSADLPAQSHAADHPLFPARALPAAPPQRVMKFVYSSGARPLDGYTIKRGIGVGGFGEVYFATSDGGKEVALKRIQRNLDVELRGVRQCLNLKHINLIDLYDIRYDQDGGAWVVMEYVSGESLKDVLDRNPNGLPEDEVRRWLDGIVQGVGCLHDHGIVHRDLKPGNIFSDRQIVKIGDYGLSKFISCSRRSGQTESVGTFHYMAPEIGKGVYGKEIDIYAIGVILYELLTGRVPFDGESSQEIIMKHLTADPDVDGLSEPYATVVRRALQKDPDRRYSSVAELLAALEGRATELADAVHVIEEQEELRLADEPPARPPIRSESAAAARRADGGQRSTSQRAPANRDTFYITEDGSGDGMVFGPVRQSSAGQREETRASSPLQGLVGAPVTTRSPGFYRSPSANVPRKSLWQIYATPIKIFALLSICLLLAATRSPALVVIAGIGLLFYAGRSVATGGWETGVALKRRAAEAKATRLCLAAQRNRAPAGETISDLLGAMLFSAIASAVICLLAVALADLPLDGSVATWSTYLWLSCVSTGGAWLVLLLGKCWECREGDRWLRRFVMLSAGLGLGIAAFVGARFLGVSFSSYHVNVSPLLHYQAWYQDGQPMLPAFLAYFGATFGVLSWSAQVDPLRSVRFSVLTTGLCVLWAWLLHTVFYFPQPWGVVLAGSISVAAQLAAPWLSPADRSRVHEAYQEVVS